MCKKVFFFLCIGTLMFLHASPVRIMPLGDSITYDDSYADVDNPRSPGLRHAYRNYLWYKLTNAGYSVNFVGSRNAGADIVPPFDPDNEGYPGYTSNQIADIVYNKLVLAKPDIVLLYIGANDWSENVSGVDRILNEIDRYEKNYTLHVKVILARIVNRRAYYKWMTNFNKNLQVLADRRVSNGDDIEVVDMEYGAGINYPDDFQDPTHPDNVGYAKIASAWFKVLKPFMKYSDDMLDLYMSGILPSVLIQKQRSDIIDYYMGAILPSITVP
jgi:hypothetical protein